jgi:sugar-specific transcriptional regulator TrmB
MKYTTYLTHIGLSEDQSKLYEILVTDGALPASSLANRVEDISRPMVYKLLEQLEKEGLVTRHDPHGKVARFEAVHPLTLRDALNKKQESLQEGRRALDAILPELINEFSAHTSAPGIRILSGVEGVAELYEDVLNEGKSLRLIRSPSDEEAPELASLVEKQIGEQVRLGIHARALTPLEPKTLKTFQTLDEKRLVTRRILPRAQFSPPAQILIYANKVAMTAFEKPFITTIIENTAIRHTFEIIFEYIWRAAEEEHSRIVGNITNSDVEWPS